MLIWENPPLDMICTLPGAGLIRQGIRFDGIGRRAASHLLRRDLGDLTDPCSAGETVGAPGGNEIHIQDPVQAGLLRGVSRFAAIR